MARLPTIYHILILLKARWPTIHKLPLLVARLPTIHPLILLVARLPTIYHVWFIILGWLSRLITVDKAKKLKKETGKEKKKDKFGEFFRINLGRGGPTWPGAHMAGV